MKFTMLCPLNRQGRPVVASLRQCLQQSIHLLREATARATPSLSAPRGTLDQAGGRWAKGSVSRPAKGSAKSGAFS